MKRGLERLDQVGKGEPAQCEEPGQYDCANNGERLAPGLSPPIKVAGRFSSAT